MLRPGPAAPAGSSPDTPKCSPTASAGLQGSPGHPRPRMCPCTSTGAEQSAAFGQPAGSRTPSQLLPGDCQQQGAGGTEDPGAMSLPFLPGGTDAGRHTGAQGAAPAGTSPCSFGTGMAPGGCLLAPHTLAPKLRSHRRLQAASSPGLAVLQPPPLQTEDAAPPSSPRFPPLQRRVPARGHGQVHAPPRSHRPPLGCCQTGMRWLSPGLAVTCGHKKGRWVLLLNGQGGRRGWGRVSGPLALWFVVLLQRGRSRSSELSRPGGASPGHGQTRARPGPSSRLPSSAWPETWQQRQCFTPVSTFGRKKGGKESFLSNPGNVDAPKTNRSSVSSLKGRFKSGWLPKSDKNDCCSGAREEFC